MKRNRNERSPLMSNKVINIILAIATSLILLSITLGLFAHFTGLNVGELIISGFKSLRYAFGGLSG